jgi:glutathione reductase (NADPH)
LSQFDYDLLVIGAGSGGIRAARESAGLGARVAIVEERYLGGTCVNVGCVPKKLLVYAAHYGHDFRDASGFGWSAPGVSFDWRQLIANKNRAIERLQGIYRKLLEQAGVAVIDGRAALAGPRAVQVGNRRYSAERILIATGSWPVIPELPGREHAITSNEAFFLDESPQRVLIVGGGYIGVEFAGIFHGLGADTTLVHRGPLILRGFDHEMREFLAGEMRKQGVRLIANCRVERILRNGALLAVLDDGARLEADCILFATGRRPNTANLGLAELGVAMTENGAIRVNDDYQSSVPSIYAIGDVTDRLKLTPVAIAEAMALSRALFGGAPARMEYHNVPTCVFSNPNCARVGLNEDDARSRYGAIDVYRSEFTPLRHSLTGRRERALIKLLVARTDGRVVGAHMVGPEAGEIIQGIAIAMKAGATKNIFDATIGIHPTAAEEFVTLRTPRRD